MKHRESEPILVNTEPSNQELRDTATAMIRDNPSVFNGVSIDDVMTESRHRNFKAQVERRWRQSIEPGLVLGTQKLNE